MAIEFNATKTQYRCPECGDWVDVELTVGTTGVELDLDRQRDNIIGHVMTNPTGHPSTIRWNPQEP